MFMAQQRLSPMSSLFIPRLLRESSHMRGLFHVSIDDIDIWRHCRE